ncbi:MAG TPA: hypothetical protein PKZ64_14660 [Spirochaetota bacterium]|nr:hypothetical protein [Spirochaetota bacterium]HPJ43172.1 hypothetical protein [Spirochaetota bacterium]HPR37847.1 hypothetical protein [Spirochaetota bacterium]
MFGIRRIYIAVIVLITGVIVFSCLFSSDSDEDNPLGYVRFTNATGSILSNISGGGATWVGPYANGATTEQKAVATGQVTITWTCGGSNYNLITQSDPGYWRLVVNNCNGTNTDVIEE